MDKRIATFVEEQPRLTVLALVGLFVVLVSVIWFAPAFLSLIVAVTIAAGWCWLLETSAPQAWLSAGCDSDSTTKNATRFGVVSRGVRPVAQRPAKPRDVSLSR